MSARTSFAATIVCNAGSLMPTSFNNYSRLFAVKQFLMTAFTADVARDFARRRRGRSR